MTTDEVLLKQAIIALGLSLDFYNHKKHGCSICEFGSGAEYITIENAELLAGDVVFPCAMLNNQVGLIISMDTDGECVFYADYKVDRLYPHQLQLTGEYMTIGEYYSEH